MSERTYGGLTAAQLAALEKAATPGPWETSIGHRGAALTVFLVIDGGDGIYLGDGQRAELAAAARNALPEMLAHIAELEGAAATAFVDGAKWWHFRETGATMWQSDQQAACEEAARLRLGEYQKWWWTLQMQAARIAELEAQLAEAHKTHELLGRAEIASLRAHGKMLPASWVYVDCETTIDLLVAELAEARKDTARLDWLEARQSYEWPYLDSTHREGTLRQEIDEAAEGK